ncbi:MAG TPA: hypothetical protein ENH82_15775 [bacterium]|nr:hypothetical protein [bacterium]
MKRPFQRVNKKGVPGIWWCETCLKLYEPELYNNIMEDQAPVEKVLKEIFYSGSPPTPDEKGDKE